MELDISEARTRGSEMTVVERSIKDLISACCSLGEKSGSNFAPLVERNSSIFLVKCNDGEV